MDSERLLASGRVHDAVVDQLVRGASADAVLATLLKRFDQDQARAIVAGAQADIEAAKTAGTFKDLEARAYLKPIRPRSIILGLVGWSCVVLGVLMGITLVEFGGPLVISVAPVAIGFFLLRLNSRPIPLAKR
jgi:hypothetical protein